MSQEQSDVTGEALRAAIADPDQDVDIALSAPARTWRLVIGSVEFWALVGGVSAIVTAITAVAAVFVGFDQLKIARDLQTMDSTYQSWNALNQATLLAYGDATDFDQLTPYAQAAMGRKSIAKRERRLFAR